ncbi:Lipase (class 3) [Novipirellula aureliae]|uniref:Lipase (Class 3) n=1 Tax=Novipirellula aureliae TaxID=2527966 RepID=A0A5C6E846_9BACT|nr:lipase family protein [Novipirellula aureliae]TWU44147.1 Lipase (class 3) [Novipirellula aureliae]
MTTILLVIAAICFFAGAIICYLASGHEHWKSAFVFWGLAFLAFAGGTYLTGHAPYIAILSVGLLVLLLVVNFFWTLPKRARSTGLSIGVLTLAGAFLVAFLGIYARPSKVETDIEDRTDWEPTPVVERTPQELLALDWSTTDESSDWPVANLTLQLSDIAYKSPVDARKLISELGFPESESINAGAMQGYVIDAGDDAIVALRGTESHEYDLLQDLRFLKVRTEQGSMHGGFVNGYDPMHDQVLQLLEQYKSKRVWITGHSLGGGLAVVCAYRLSENDEYPIAGVMTFGQPKAVRADIAEFLRKKLDDKYVFFVNQMDPITRLISPYQHFGHMVWWNGTEIERSKRLLMYGGNGQTETKIDPSESGYIDPMSDEELDKLIQDLEQAGRPAYDQDGNLVVQGIFIQGQDHFLDSYREMVEQLRTHRFKSD